MSWIFLLLLFHAGVSTIGTGGMSWILLSMLLHTGLFDNNTDGSFIEAALYLWGVIDDQLFITVARQLKKKTNFQKMKELLGLNIDEIENAETLSLYTKHYINICNGFINRL